MAKHQFISRSAKREKLANNMLNSVMIFIFSYIFIYKLIQLLIKIILFLFSCSFFEKQIISVAECNVPYLQILILQSKYSNELDDNNMDLINNLCSKLFSYFINCFLKDQSDQLSDNLIQMKQMNNTSTQKQKNSTIGALAHQQNLSRHFIQDSQENQNSVVPHNQQILTVSITKVIKNSAASKRKSTNRATDAIFTFGQKPSSNPKQRFSKSSNKNSEQNRKMKLTFDIEIFIINKPDYASMMGLWSQNAFNYMKLPNDYSYLNHAMKIKVNRHIFLGLAIKKIEGFQTLQTIKQQTFDRPNTCTQNLQSINQLIGVKFGQYQNSQIGLRCMYKRKSKRSNKTKDYNFVKMITFEADTRNILSVLKWYNSSRTWEALYDILNFKLIENQRYCVFQVEQVADKITKKHTYTILRQIKLVRLSHQPSKQYIVQTDITIGRDTTFRSYMRFQVSDRGKVEVLSESSERTDGKNHLLYHDQWKKFEQKLIKYKIVKNNHQTTETDVTQREQEFS